MLAQLCTLLSDVLDLARCSVVQVTELLQFQYNHIVTNDLESKSRVREDTVENLV